MDKLNLAQDFLKEINNLGYESYIVGGAARDYFLARPINDIDITTNAPIDLIKEKYEVYNLHAKKYLGVTILYKNMELEITHFRKDVCYSDCRHPLVIEANTLASDLKRRDFTVNALALDYKFKLYDRYNGLNDLNRHLLKAIGRPNRRFNEDALRILRGIYFSLKLGFKIESKTFRAMRNKAYLLEKLQIQTAINELIKIFSLEFKDCFKLFKKLNLKKNLPYLKSTLYYLERDNYYPKNSYELIALISFYNGALLDINIKKEWKKRINSLLAKGLNKDLKISQILNILEKGEENV